MSNAKTWKQKFFRTVFIILIVSVVAAILSEFGNPFEGVLLLPLFPGFLLYVISTGDIHGWKPGPIGQAGRVAVTAFGAWIFWSLVAFMIYKARQIRREK